MFKNIKTLTFVILGSIVTVVICSGCNSAVEQSNQEVESGTGQELVRLKVAAVSSNSKFCNIKGNLRHFGSLIEQAHRKGVRLVCFPELALMGYSVNPAILDAAEEVPGPSTKELCRIARENDLYISMGLAEKDDDKFYVTQVIVGPKGYVGKYRKYHPTPKERKCGFSKGESFPVFDIDGFKLGVNICADGRHWDTIEAMREAEVDIIHHPHGNWLGLGVDAEEWTRGKMTYFVPRVTYARAYILVNNSAGSMTMPDGQIVYFGSGALVIDPLGQVIARTVQKNRSEKMIIATVVKPFDSLIPMFERDKLYKNPVFRYR